MLTDYFSNLPIDIYKEIFFNHSDEGYQLECLNINKRINECVSILLLSDLNIPLDGTLKPYSQLMKYYKSYCEFFNKKLPNAFELTTCKTVMEAKKMVDSKLITPISFEFRGYHPDFRNPFPSSLLNESWSRFIRQIDPRPSSSSQSFAKNEPKPNENYSYNDSVVLNFNEDVQMFLKARASTVRLEVDIFESIIKQSWCTLETAKMLLNYKIEIKLGTILTAIRSEKFKILLPDLLKNAPLNISLSSLCNNISSDYESIIKEYYLARMPQVSSQVCSTGLYVALKGNYSEKFISEMLEKCSENVDSSLIRLAIEKEHSEILILDLLNKCSGNVDNYHLLLAIHRSYPDYLIEKLLAKVNDKITVGYICSAVDLSYSESLIEKLLAKMDDEVTCEVIRRAACHHYSEAFLTLLMNKVKKDSLTKSLETLMKYGLYPMTIEKFLPESEGDFSYDTAAFVVSNKYPENIFLTVFNRTIDQNDCIQRTLQLEKVMNVYSAKTVELLIDKGVEVITNTYTQKAYTSYLYKAMELHYPEAIVDKILSKISYVESKDIQKAEEMSYSIELIEKMRAKCEGEGGFCSIM